MSDKELVAGSLKGDYAQFSSATRSNKPGVLSVVRGLASCCGGNTGIGWGGFYGLLTRWSHLMPTIRTLVRDGATHGIASVSDMGGLDIEPRS